MLTLSLRTEAAQHPLLLLPLQHNRAGTVPVGPGGWVGVGILAAKNSYGWRFMDLKDKFKIMFRKEYQVSKSESSSKWAIKRI